MTSRRRQGCEPQRPGRTAHTGCRSLGGVGLWTGGGSTQQSPRPTADQGFSAEPHRWTSAEGDLSNGCPVAPGASGGLHIFGQKQRAPAQDVVLGDLHAVKVKCAHGLVEEDHPRDYRGGAIGV